MIEYSKQESEIFGVDFGRLDMKSDFTDWNKLEEEIKNSRCKYIRAKIRNPTSNQTQQLNRICKRNNLLEILRIYSFTPDFNKEYVFSFDEYIYKDINKDNIDKLFKLIKNSYQDIPFGNYTTLDVLKVFPIEKQMKNLTDYYRKGLLKPDSNMKSQLIYNLNNEIIGCIVTELFRDCSYTNYVGVLNEFKNKHVLTKTINFIQYQVVKNKLTAGLGGARLSNLYSQKAFESNNMIFDGYDFIYLMEV